MIDHTGAMIQHLLMRDVRRLRTPDINPNNPPHAVTSDQIGFRPPDDKWKAYVSGLTVSNLPASALNIYLVDLNENRSLRSNERIRQFHNGMVEQQQAPMRLDCHYLLSAWSPAIVNQANDATVDDEFQRLHALLYETGSVLLRNTPLKPSAVYAPNPVPNTFPQNLHDHSFPVSILPVGRFGKLSEFWNTMGAQHRWFPAIYFILTVPVIQDTSVAGPMVTTRIIEMGLRTSAVKEHYIEIGGFVFDNVGNPVGGAWVQIETLLGVVINQTATSEENSGFGGFTFARLQADDYVLRVRIPGHNETTKQITVPSQTDDYSVTVP